MKLTAQLRDDHDAIVKLVVEFKSIIAAPKPPAGVDLVKFRHLFSKQLLAHLAREDMLLYPMLQQSKDPLVASTARAFIDEMGGLLAAYKDWSARWPTERLAEQWPQFVTETDALLKALSQRIARENAELYPLVEGDIAKAA